MTLGWRRAACIFALAAACYGNTLANDLVWDDRLTAVVPRRATRLLTERVGSYYRPLVMLSFAWDRTLWGEHAAGFHATNLVLHAVAGCLVGTLAIALGLGEGPAFASALLFVAHPVQTDAVAYVSGRTDVLCALFALGALLAWRRARAPTDPWAIATALLLVAALASKETAVLLPLVLLVPGAHPAARPPRPVLPFVVAAAGLAIWMRVGGPGLHLGGLAARLPAIAAATLEALRLVVWPVDLHLERFVSVPGWSTPGAVALWISLVAIVAALALAASRVAGGWVLLALAAATYLPVANVVPIYPAIADRALFTAEHFLYLPLCGLVPLAVGVEATWIPVAAGRAIVAALLVASVPLVVARNRDWRDEETLFRHTLRYDPPAARVWYDLANLRLAAGDPVEAERLYRAALARSPRDAAAHLNLGIALQRQGRGREAVAEYDEAVRLDPSLANAFRPR